VIEHQPSLWRCVMTGATAPGAGSSKFCRFPSIARQPKLAPAPVPRLRKSISSTWSWPTSPIVRSPVRRSKDQRHGLRRP
jgi:hypothetical protein